MAVKIVLKLETQTQIVLKKTSHTENNTHTQVLTLCTTMPAHVGTYYKNPPTLPAGLIGGAVFPSI